LATTRTPQALNNNSTANVRKEAMTLHYFGGNVPLQDSRLGRFITLVTFHALVMPYLAHLFRAINWLLFNAKQ
jgi:hypothetical protein